MSLPLTSSQSSVQALWFIAHTTASKKLVRFRLLYQSSPEIQDINKHRKFRLNILIKGHISWLLHLATKRQEKNIEYAWKFQLKTGNFIYQSPESLLKTITSVNKQKEYRNQMLFANSFERWDTKKILSSRRTLHVGRIHGFSHLQGFICSLWLSMPQWFCCIRGICFLQKGWVLPSSPGCTAVKLQLRALTVNRMVLVGGRGNFMAGIICVSMQFLLAKWIIW